MTGESGTFKMYVSSGSSGLAVIVQLVANTGQTVADVTQTAVVFNDPTDHTTHPDQFDPYSLRSTTSLTIGGVSTPAGSAVVITDATEGYWEISLRGKYSLAPSSPFEALGQFFIYYENGPDGSDFFPPATQIIRAQSWENEVQMATFGANLISGQQLGVSANQESGADGTLDRIYWRLRRIGGTIPT